MGHIFISELIESLPDGIVAVGTDGAVLYANRSARRYTEKPYAFYPCLRQREANIPCGQHPWCRGCELGTSLDALLSAGTTFSDLCLERTYLADGEERTAYLLVSGAAMTTDTGPCAVLSMTNVTALRQREQSMLQELELEPHTRTLNKNSLYHYITRLRKSGQEFILCMIDFDWFKRVNDRCGHVMGDKVLKAFARIARQHMSGGDMIGRYGGDEFVVVFQDITREEAIRRVSRINSDIQEEFTAVLPGFDLSYSAGMVSVHGDTGGELIDLVKEADRLMYAGKNRGKNRLMTAEGEYVFIHKKSECRSC